MVVQNIIEHNRSRRGERYRETYDGARRSERTKMPNGSEKYPYRDNRYGKELLYGKGCQYEGSAYEGDEKGANSPSCSKVSLPLSKETSN